MMSFYAFKLHLLIDFQKRNQFLNRPNMVRNPRFYSRSNSQGPVNTAKIVKWRDAVKLGRKELFSGRVAKSFFWPLSTGTTARLDIIGNEELTAEHIDALSQYLVIAKKLLKPNAS